VGSRVVSAGHGLVPERELTWIIGSLWIASLYCTGREVRIETIELLRVSEAHDERAQGLRRYLA